MEWQTANNAYEVVSRVGFRTFVQAEVKGGESWTYEPFSPADSDFEKTGECACHVRVRAYTRGLAVADHCPIVQHRSITPRQATRRWPRPYLGHSKLNIHSPLTKSCPYVPNTSWPQPTHYLR